MAIRTLSACALTLVVLAIAVVGEDQMSVRVDDHNSRLTREMANRIELALLERSDCNFEDRPLDQAMKDLAVAHRIPIWIDKAALSDEGINIDQQVTLQLAGITLQTALSLILEPLGLTNLVRDGVMIVTTQAVADESMTTRVYIVGDLVDIGTTEQDYISLIELIQNCTHSKWMAIDQEGGAAQPFPNARSLVIQQTQKTHRSIEGMLSALRRAKRLQGIPSLPTDGTDSDFLTPAESARTTRMRIAPEGTTPTWQRPRVYSE